MFHVEICWTVVMLWEFAGQFVLLPEFAGQFVMLQKFAGQFVMLREFENACDTDGVRNCGKGCMFEAS